MEVTFGSQEENINWIVDKQYLKGKTKTLKAVHYSDINNRVPDPRYKNGIKP